jgi:hypothetical protein
MKIFVIKFPVHKVNEITGVKANLKPCLLSTLHMFNKSDTTLNYSNTNLIIVFAWHQTQ